MTKNPKPLHRVRKWVLIAGLVFIAVGLCGCQTFSFYRQAIAGQYELIAHRQSIESLLKNPNTAASLKVKLELLEQLRDFAQKELKLPVDGHYSKYVDVHRRFVVWNVEAAPEFSMQPKTWWYPVVGSLAYRG